MICLVENKYKQTLYKVHINKDEELNEKIYQQI